MTEECGAVVCVEDEERRRVFKRCGDAPRQVGWRRRRSKKEIAKEDKRRPRRQKEAVTVV